jgi:hypothetical protein
MVEFLYVGGNIMGEENWGKVVIDNKNVDISNMSVAELENIKSDLEQKQAEIESKINNFLGL